MWRVRAKRRYPADRDRQAGSQMLRVILVVALGVALSAVARERLRPVAAQPASVRIVNFAFAPAELIVPAGTPVTWVNNDQVAHTTTSDAGVWDSGRLGPGQMFSFRFIQAGTFTYHCAIHPNMRATVTVSGQVTPTPTPVPPPPAPAAAPAPPPVEAAKIFSAAGADAAAIQAAVDAFRAELGDNNGVGGAFPTGRREINWDGVPDAVAAPNMLPADFFNTASARGIVFSTPGSGFQVSANEGVAPVRFGSINPAYSTLFSVFSPQRLFTALDSTIIEARFFLPGTDTVATVNGFGVVFTNVQHADTTTLELFDSANASLGVFAAPVGPPAGLSFIGVVVPPGVRVAWVRITSGSAALGPDVDDTGPVNLVVMDDFIYGEPQAAAPGTAQPAPPAAPPSTY